MKKGFSTIMAAQFFSSLADNALFVAAIELMKTSGSSEWMRAALVPMFALFYVVLAPFLGAISDALPKGRVMFISNAIKVVGCLMMVAGVSPLLSYAIVGLGAAAYSPAKYGILTELLPPSQLVKANGWIEGLTLGSTILGLVLGGQLVRPDGVARLLHTAWPGWHTSASSPAAFATAAIMLLYGLAALFNLRIPRTDAPLQPMSGNPLALVRDFASCNALLWSDCLGQISLATTTVFWGAAANLRYIVLAWAAAVFGFNTGQASSLIGVVMIGTALGVLLASVAVRLERATIVIPLGIAMGLMVMTMNAIHSVAWAVPFLVVMGACGGFLAVPMNALLQHRGHSLMGAGRSIAVQNFNEQAAILAFGAFYTGVTRLGFALPVVIGLFGGLVACAMGLVGLWHRRNVRTQGAEIQRLLEIAQNDGH